MALDRELVLLGAADLPFLGHDRAVLAHREAGARLLVAGDLGDDVAGADLGQRPQFAHRRALAVGLQQGLAQPLVEGDRRVGGGVGAAGDAGVDLAEGDLVGDQDRRLQAGAAGLLDVVGGGLGGEAGAEHALAGQVAVARVLEDGAAGDLAERLALEAVAVDQAVEGGGQHVLVARVRVDAVGAREGDPVAADDGDLAGLGFIWGRVLLGVSWKLGAERSRRPGSTVEMRSSAASSALIASVRSHQRASASEAPSRAVERASTSTLAASRRRSGSCASSEAETRSRIWPR